MANKAFVVKHGLNPSTDNSVDLGTSSLEFKDLYIDGTAFLYAIGFGSVAMTLPTDHGINGQVLKTNGSNALAWANDTAGTITALNNQTEDRLVTIGSTTTQLDGEADLTFDGTTLNVVGNAGVGIARTDGTLHVHTASAGSIAANTDADDLVVENSGDVGIQLISPDANYSRIWFNHPNSGSGSTAQIRYANSSQSMHFKAGSSEPLVLKSDGDVEVSDGDLVIGTSGHGIDFSADGQASGMTSELLDDYEEGTWTPVVKYDGTAGTAYSTGSANVATYTKVGRVVYVAADYEITNPSADNDTSTVILTGLPFTSANIAQWWRMTTSINKWTKTNGAGVIGAVGANGTYVAMYKQMNDGNWDQDVKSNEVYQASGSVWIGISGFYHI